MRRVLIVLICTVSLISSAQLSANWLGKYSGELNSTDINGFQMTYHMELEIGILTDTSYTFNIIYGEDSTKQVRAYRLFNSGINHFIMDEQNGILLDMSYGFNRLTSVFEIEGAFLHISYVRTKKGISFELTSSKKSHNTGDKIHEGEKIPLVTSYKTLVFQTAELKKMK
ncbi:MAG: hypothetical protein H6582_06095 [Crocinitomicaceae bacterium]|nr:hypothetical protein [Crocinitomicaceae bacterium]